MDISTNSNPKMNTNIQNYPVNNPNYNQTYYPPLAVKKEQEPFNKLKYDTHLFILCFITGIFFIEVFLESFFVGIGITLFSAFYIALVFVYVKVNNVKVKKESWIWLSFLILTAISFLYSTFDFMQIWRVLLLFTSCFSWCISLFSVHINQKLDNYFIFDLVNSVLFIPMKNFLLGFQTIEKTKQPIIKNKKYQSVLIGILVFIPVFLFVIPLLYNADSGYFSKFIEAILRYINTINISEGIIKVILSIPVSLYISGKLLGMKHKRYIKTIQIESLQKIKQSLEKLQELTVQTVLVLVSLLYTLYIVCQIPYYFLAFVGKIPDGFDSYSSYARKGFFELCTITIINISVLLFLYVLQNGKRSKITKILYCIVCSINIVFIITALQKMILYMGAYGLTNKRVLTSIFMVYIAILCLGIIILQFKYYSIVKFSVILGMSVLCILSVIGLQDIIVKYNFNAYINKELTSFDTNLLYSAKNSSLEIVLENFDAIPDNSNKKYIKSALKEIYVQANERNGILNDNITYYLIRNNEKLKSLIQ